MLQQKKKYIQGLRAPPGELLWGVQGEEASLEEQAEGIALFFHYNLFLSLQKYVHFRKWENNHWQKLIPWSNSSILLSLFFFFLVLWFLFSGHVAQHGGS